MSWLTPKLRHRIQLLVPVRVPNAQGGFDRGYRRLLTVWAGISDATKFGMLMQYVRGVQVDEATTHEFTVRKVALAGITGDSFDGPFSDAFRRGVAGIGRDFSIDFGLDFDSIVDHVPIKSEMYMLLQSGPSSLRGQRGRLFRVRNLADVKERGEYMSVHAEEIEAQGFGADSSGPPAGGVPQVSVRAGRGIVRPDDHFISDAGDRLGP